MYDLRNNHFYNDIDKKKIALKETIKTIGTTTVDVKLFEGVVAKLKVSTIVE